MGRRKIKMKKIQNKRQRQIALCKRKRGIMKKVCELSILCDCEIFLYISKLEKNGKNTFYSSKSDINDMITQTLESIEKTPKDTFSLNDYAKLFGLPTED